MLDIKYIREHPEQIKKALRNRGVAFNVDYLLRLDEKRRAKIKEVDDLRARQNELSDEIAKKSFETKSHKIAGAKQLKAQLGKTEFEMKMLEDEFHELMYKIPNIPLDDVPVGKDASKNKVIRKLGKIPKFHFEPKDHLELGAALDIIDVERAAKVTGTRFNYFRKEAALLEFALIQFTFSFLTAEKELKKIADSIVSGYSAKPFIPIIPPVMVRPDVMTKMARLAEQDKDERYYFPKDDLYLVGSAEHTLGSMHMDEVFNEEDLPIRYLGFSTSFRRESGSYGQDTRGVLRVHQFDKIEMESFTLATDSVKEQDFIVAVQEKLVQALKIPYQVVKISTGDMGKPDARQIDIECWMPGQSKYRETHTSDLMTDYQARRLNTRLRRKDGTTEFVHMNDATAFAIGRTIIAILENYQREDGSIEIPKVLQPYMHGLKEILR